MLRVLLVEDNPADADLVCELLSQAEGDHHFVIEHVGELSQATQWCVRNSVDVILLDLGLPDAQEMVALERLRALRPAVAIVVLTGMAGQERALSALRMGAQDYLTKGEFTGELLDKTIRHAIERHRQAWALKKSVEQQRIVAELGQRALKEADLDVLMREVVAGVSEGLNVELVKVLELLPDQRSLLLRAGVGWGRGLVGRATVGADCDSQAGYTLLANEPVIVEDLRSEKRFGGPPLLREHHVVSGVSVVIHGKERPFGVIGAHTTQLRVFTPDDALFLRSVANVLGAAIERRRQEEQAKLLSEEQARRAEAEAAHERAAFLAKASGILSESLDYEATLSKVAHLALEKLGDWCVIDLRDREDEGKLHRVALAHRDPAKVDLLRDYSRRYPPNRERGHLIHKVLESGRSELVAQIPESLKRQIVENEEQMRMLEELGATSCLIVPLKAHERVLGTIGFVSAEANRYETRDLVLAEALADRAALAIDNALLYRQATEAVRAREEFLSIASHELKTPLTAQQLQVQVLRRRVAKENGGEIAAEFVKEACENLRRQGDRLAKLIGNLLDVSRITAGKMRLNPEEMDLSKLVQSVVERHDDESRLAGCKVSLRAAEGVVGRWDRLRIEQVVTNLFGNALKYGQGEPVDVAVDKVGEWARFTVQDRGIGMEEADQKRIFNRFERGRSATTMGGLGLGLYIAKQIVDAHGGTIEVASALGRGTTFTVMLPLGG